jgi:hypothetical protein
VGPLEVCRGIHGSLSSFDLTGSIRAAANSRGVPTATSPGWSPNTTPAPASVTSSGSAAARPRRHAPPWRGQCSSRCAQNPLPRQGFPLVRASVAARQAWLPCVSAALAATGPTRYRPAGAPTSPGPGSGRVALLALSARAIGSPTSGSAAPSCCATQPHRGRRAARLRLTATLGVPSQPAPRGPAGRPRCPRRAARTSTALAPTLRRPGR